MVEDTTGTYALPVVLSSVINVSTDFNSCYKELGNYPLLILLPPCRFVILFLANPAEKCDVKKEYYEKAMDKA